MPQFLLFFKIPIYAAARLSHWHSEAVKPAFLPGLMGPSVLGRPVDGSDLEEGLVWLNQQTAGLLFTMTSSVCVHVCVCTWVDPS